MAAAGVLRPVERGIAQRAAECIGVLRCEQGLVAGQADGRFAQYRRPAGGDGQIDAPPAQGIVQAAVLQPGGGGRGAFRRQGVAAQPQPAHVLHPAGIRRGPGAAGREFQAA